MIAWPSLCLATLAGTSAQEVAPVIPGLHERHALDQAAVGRLLLDELRCGSCHEGIAPEIVSAAAPDLNQVGVRVSPDYLRRFIVDPAGTRPGTKMPGMFHLLEASERAAAGEALTHFLVAGSGWDWSRGQVEQDELAAGEDLFHTVGCVACHPPRRPPAAPAIRSATPAASAGAVDLAHVPAKYGVESLAKFLYLPGAAHPSGRMPDMGLSRVEAVALAHYLIGKSPPAGSALHVRQDRIWTGERYFRELNCGACHALSGIAAEPRIATVGVLDPERGCLDESGTSSPRFHLSTEQKAAIKVALEDRTAPTDTDRIAHTLTAFNCIACHVRDDHGGLRTAIDPYFETTEHDLGDQARIPPPLTLTGAKLQGEWLRKVVFDGASVRPYMFTRMPRFGETNLAHLPALFEREDAGQVGSFEMPIPEGEEARAARDAGRELVGNRGLACVACHDFNGRPSLTHAGIDLINTTERLQPSWFARFLIEPQTYRPGIVMPESWSGGVAAHTGILGGDTEAQIEAIWYYLSQGRTARDPEGMRSVRSHLVVTDEPRVYRGRSGIAGFRAIAVGFPGGLNYAFDAQAGTLAALWSGDFVAVRWDGQGSGDFLPLGKTIQLARDTSFCRLPDAASAWPARPRMDAENPVNPDPLYPRNQGYRFRGYALDEQRIPTFRYASGDVAIEDRSTADTTGARPVLRRTLRLSSPRAQRIFFLVLNSELEQVSEREFRTPRLRLKLPDRPCLLRTSEEEGVAPELLLELDLPAGTTSLTIEYEPLD